MSAAPHRSPTPPGAPASPPPPTAARPSRTWLPLLLAPVIAVAFLAQPLWNLDRTGSTDDWRWFTFHWSVSRHTVLEHGQLPVWNPYHCGGNVHLANPQTQYLSPLAWPGLLLGVNLGLKLFILVHLLLGFAGCWWLARDLGLRPWPAALPAALFAGSGYLFMHVGGGHSSFLPFLFMPAALAGFRRSIERPRWVILPAGALALMVLEGGVYPTPYTALLLAAYAVGRWARRPDDLRPLARLALVAVLGGALAAVKLVPVLAFLREHPRHVPSDDGMGLVEVLMAFTSRRLERRFPGHNYVWPEYGAYLGWPVVVAVAALAWRRGRRYLGLLALLLFFVALMTGNRGGGWSPHELLHELPIYGSLHVPSRYGVVVTLLLALLAGCALQEWLDALTRAPLRRRARLAARAVTVLIAVAAVVDVLTFGQWQMGRFKDSARTEAPRSTYQTTRAAWAHGPSFPRRRIGTLRCYEPNGVPRGKVRPKLPAEVFVAGGAKGKVQVLSWSPALVEAEVELQQPGLVVLNQNDHRGWQVEGADRGSHDGMPAGALSAPGTHRIRFIYRPPGLRLGTLITLLAALGVGLWLSGWLRRPSRRLYAAIGGWIWAPKGDGGADQDTGTQSATNERASGLESRST